LREPTPEIGARSRNLGRGAQCPAGGFDKLTNGHYVFGVGRKAGVTADETRKQLISAAARVFAERGYEGATIADIARQAGLSTGAIYAHYRSKAELLAEAIRAQSAREVARMVGEDRELTMTEALALAGSGLARRGRGKSLLLEAVSAARRDPDLATAMIAEVGGGEARFVEMLRRAQTRGTAELGASPEIIARFSLMLNLGAQAVDALGLPAVDKDEWTEFMTALVHGFRRGPRQTRVTIPDESRSEGAEQ
jgi:AcrR family transcriptional regulator